MKLHLLSDLHTKHCRYGPARVCADVLLLAGDIGDDGNLGAIEVAQNYLAQGLPVLYVAGNHEFYGTRIEDEKIRLRAECTKAGITLLENESVVLGGVRFVGATLWTDFCLDGEGVAYRAKLAARQQIADFTWIFEGPNICLKPDTTVEWHRESRRYIEATVAEPFDGPTVVMTHHGWHARGVAERFKNSMINGAFLSNLTKTMQKGIDVVVHGHVHNSIDFMVEGPRQGPDGPGAPVKDTRVVTNPRGYAKQVLRADGSIEEIRENKDFDPEKVIEI